ALAVVGGAVAVLVRRRPRGAAQSPAPTAPARPAAPPAEATDTLDAAVPTGAAGTAPPPVEVPDDLRTVPLEVPEPVAGRMQRLRERLARSGSPLGARLLGVLSRADLGEDDWDELEETLLLADVGAGPTAELIDGLRTRVKVEGLRDAA